MTWSSWVFFWVQWKQKLWVPLGTSSWRRPWHKHLSHLLCEATQLHVDGGRSCWRRVVYSKICCVAWRALDLWFEIFFLPYVTQQGNYIKSTQLPRPLHPQSSCSALQVTLDFLTVLYITKLIFFQFKVGKIFCIVKNKTKAKTWTSRPHGTIKLPLDINISAHEAWRFTQSFKPLLTF